MKRTVFAVLSLFFVLSFVLPAASAEGNVTLQSVVIRDHQLIFQINGGVTPVMATLANPDRLVIDFPGVSFGDGILVPSPGTTQDILSAAVSVDSLVSSMRYLMYDPRSSTIRFVADLRGKTKVKTVNNDEPGNFTVQLEAAEPASLPVPVLAPAAKPQSSVLIYHSHNRESFLSLLPRWTRPFSAFDRKQNVSLLGNRLASNLRTAGAQVYHAMDDYPAIYGSAFNIVNSYLYSEKTVRGQMFQHPQIKYLFDIHRDDSSRGVTTAKIRGTNYAKLMFVVGTANPNWHKNDVFAKRIQSYVNARYPGLSRGIYYKSRSQGNGQYNQQLSSSSALIEVGGVYNTLTETNRTVDILSAAINQARKAG